MTDARLPSRWLTDPDLDNLSDRAWRTWTNCLMWSAGVGSDGRLPAKSLRFLYADGVDADTATELVTAGLWAVTDDGSYQVVEWAPVQSLAAVVQKQREDNRLRQQRYRDNMRDVTRDVTDVVTRESPRQGQARQGAVKELELSVTSAGDSRSVASDDCPNCARLGVNGPCNSHYWQRKQAGGHA